MSKTFTVTTEELNEYVGCKYIKTPKDLLLHQGRLIEKIEERLGERFKSLERYETPLSPGYTAGKPKEGDLLLNPEEQREYQGEYVGISVVICEILYIRDILEF